MDGTLAWREAAAVAWFVAWRMGIAVGTLLSVLRGFVLRNDTDWAPLLWWVVPLALVLSFVLLAWTVQLAVQKRYAGFRLAVARGG